MSQQQGQDPLPSGLGMESNERVRLLEQQDDQARPLKSSKEPELEYEGDEQKRFGQRLQEKEQRQAQLHEQGILQRDKNIDFEGGNRDAQ